MWPKILSLLLLALLAFSSDANAQQAYGTPVPVTKNTSAASNLVVLPSAGFLYGFSATSGASAGYVMAFDATAVPADGAVSPVLCFGVGAASSFGVSYVQYPLPFVNGLIFVFSTTGCFTKTASSTAFFSVQAK